MNCPLCDKTHEVEERRHLTTDIIKGENMTKKISHEISSDIIGIHFVSEASIEGTEKKQGK